jgi:hypothetical protein
VAGLVDVEQGHRLSTLGWHARAILDFFDGTRVRISLSFVGNIIDIGHSSDPEAGPSSTATCSTECLEGRGRHGNRHVDRDGDAGRPVRGNQQRPGNVPRA